MLVLSRKKDEIIQTTLDKDTLEELLTMVRITGEPVVITFTLVEIRKEVARIGIDAPRTVPVHRGEVLERIRARAEAKRRS